MSVNEFQGHFGQGAGEAIELQKSPNGKTKEFTCEVIHEAIKSRVVADAINQAEFGLYLVHKTLEIDGVKNADRPVGLTGLVANEGVERYSGPWISGVLFRDGKYFLVNCGEVHALDESGFQHGASVRGYIAKYLLAGFGERRGDIYGVSA